MSIIWCENEPVGDMVIAMCGVDSGGFDNPCWEDFPCTYRDATYSYRVGIPSVDYPGEVTTYYLCAMLPDVEDRLWLCEERAAGLTKDTTKILEILGKFMMKGHNSSKIRCWVDPDTPQNILMKAYELVTARVK
jgi:hypothetical protein